MLIRTFVSGCSVTCIRVVHLKKNVTFDSLDEESQKLLSILGFESGDNLSEMAENLLKKKGMTLDEYLKGER